MVFHFLGTVVPLCTPHILVDIVVEIDMGTQVITLYLYSPPFDTQKRQEPYKLITVDCDDIGGVCVLRSESE